MYWYFVFLAACLNRVRIRRDGFNKSKSKTQFSDRVKRIIVLIKWQYYTSFWFIHRKQSINISTIKYETDCDKGNFFLEGGDVNIINIYNIYSKSATISWK